MNPKLNYPCESDGSHHIASYKDGGRTMQMHLVSKFLCRRHRPHKQYLGHMPLAKKRRLLTQGGITSRIHSRFCSLPYILSSLHSPTNSHTNLAHCHHQPPLSRWPHQRRKHGNGGNKDNMATPVIAGRRQHVNRVVAEGVARQQRWRGYCGGGSGAVTALAWQRWVA